MAIKIKNLFDNDNLKCIESKGIYSVYEHQNDLSVTPWQSEMEYFMNKMNVRKRQVLCQMENSQVKLQAGAMQWQTGNIQMNSDVAGVKDLLGKFAKGVVSGESAVKPLYSGTGNLMLEPTYNHILIEDLADWNNGIVLDDGLFLACDAQIQESIVRRQDLKTAVFSGEGIFNLSLTGQGQFVLESPVPRAELYEFYLDNDIIKIDGNMAIAWSSTINFTTEKSTKSLIGSALSGEGFVNVFYGTGRILMAPTLYGTEMDTSDGPEDKNATKNVTGAVGNLLGGLLGDD